MLAFGVSKTPALVILRGEEVEVYEGELDSLRLFFIRELMLSMFAWV